MKRNGLKSPHKNISRIVCFFSWLPIFLIVSLSVAVAHGFAKDKEISGHVRMSSGEEIGGTTITFSNGEGFTTTDSSGYYSQKVKEGWSGTGTPSKAGYNFDPAYRDYSNIKRNQTNQDYTGILQTRTISGYIRTMSGSGFDGVTVVFDNGGGTETTDSSGYYEGEVTYGWSGTITPFKDGFSFVPAFRSNLKVVFNQSNQDYIGAQDQIEPSSNLEVGGADGDDGYGCFLRNSMK